MPVFETHNPALAEVWPRSLALSSANRQVIDGFEFITTRLGVDRLKSGISVVDVGAGSPSFLQQFRDRALSRSYQIKAYAVDLSQRSAEFGECGISYYCGDMCKIPAGKNEWPSEFDIINLNAPNGVPSQGALLKLLKLCAPHGFIMVRYAVGEEHHAKELAKELREESIYCSPEVFHHEDVYFDSETYPQGSDLFRLGSPVLIKKRWNPA